MVKKLRDVYTDGAYLLLAGDLNFSRRSPTGKSLISHGTSQNKARDPKQGQKGEKDRKDKNVFWLVKSKRINTHVLQGRTRASLVPITPISFPVSLPNLPIHATSHIEQRRVDQAITSREFFDIGKFPASPRTPARFTDWKPVGKSRICNTFFGKTVTGGDSPRSQSCNTGFSTHIRVFHIFSIYYFQRL